MTLPDAISDIANQSMPKHVAIIMDGNGRWAQQRGKIRVAGHKAGVGLWVDSKACPKAEEAWRRQSEAVNPVQYWLFR